jgi:Hemerythrin HHE cation binding domain
MAHAMVPPEVPADEPAAEPDHGPDLAALLRGDHRRLREELAAFAEAGPFRRRDELERLIADLVGHETVEQVLAHPLLAQVEGGDALRRELLAEERSLMAQLNAARRAVRWHSRLQLHEIVPELIAAIEEHFLAEEARLLPVVDEVDNGVARQVRGTWAFRVRHWAPTRPHPHAPQKPAGWLAVGPFLKFSDHLRDRMSIARSDAT